MGRTEPKHILPVDLPETRSIATQCPICKDLEAACESRLSDYAEARSAAYYRISTELAAYKNVEMERARSELEEHRLVCVLQALP
jgi:hypothetical protein